MDFTWNSYQSYWLSKRSWSIIPFQNEFWAILTASEGILSNLEEILSNPDWSWRNSEHLTDCFRGNSVCFWRNSNQTWLLLMDFWALLTAPEGILSNPDCSRGNSHQFWLILKEFLAILTAPDGILSNPISWQKDADHCSKLLKEFRTFWPPSYGILPTPACLRVNPACSSECVVVGTQSFS